MGSVALSADRIIFAPSSAVVNFINSSRYHAFQPVVVRVVDYRVFVAAAVWLSCLLFGLEGVNLAELVPDVGIGHV